MLTALGRRGSRGALAALARAARGGEVRIFSVSISSDRRVASFFLSLHPSLPLFYLELLLLLGLFFCRDAQTGGHDACISEEKKLDSGRGTELWEAMKLTRANDESDGRQECFSARSRSFLFTSASFLSFSLFLCP